MQVELYVDVFFLTNFIMDYLLLLLVNKALSCSSSQGRIVFGAFAGALATCILVCSPLPPAAKQAGIHLLVNTGMLLTGLRLKSPGSFLKAFFMLYLAGFLLGGIMTWLGQYLGGFFRIGALYLTLTICSYILASQGIRFLEMLWKLKGYRCSVTLCLEERHVTFSARIDSGNGLRDPLNGKAVHIISKRAMKKLTEVDFAEYAVQETCKERHGSIRAVRYIPYRTVQKQGGVLPVMEIDRMIVHMPKQEKREDREICSPLLGISEQESFGSGTYDLLLHPEE